MVDLDALREQFEKEWAEQNPVQDEPVDNADNSVDTSDDVEDNFELDDADSLGDEDLEDLEDTEDVEGDDLDDEPLDDGEPQRGKRKQSPEENRKFAEFRVKMKQMEEELQKAKAYQQFLEEVAKRNGLQSPDQLIEAVRKKQLEEEAKQKGIPVDVYERLMQSESEIQRLRQEMEYARLQGEIEAIKAKYGATDEDISKAFDYIGQNGYFDPNLKVPLIKLEDAFLLANRDALLQRKEREGKQKLLEAKRQRQQKVAPVPKNTAPVPPQSDVMTDEEFYKTLERLGFNDLLQFRR